MKQVLICSGLVAADMPDQLFGHALAVRWGEGGVSVVLMLRVCRRLGGFCQWGWQDTTGVCTDSGAWRHDEQHLAQAK